MIRVGAITIANALICDDVRVEQTGKHILIGVYSGDIGVPSFPANVAFNFWLQTRQDLPGKLELEFTIKDDADVVFAQGTAEAEVSKDLPGVMVLGPIGIQVQRPSRISLMMRPPAGDWVEVAGAKVTSQEP